MKALVVVDLQNDFLPGGALAVKEGDNIVPLINRLMEGPFDLVVATKDWHPEDHTSFAVNHPGKKPGDHVTELGIDQILWPVHCVQETFGAEFSPMLNQKLIKKIFHKGTEPKIDSYSTFWDNKHKRSTGLYDYLKERRVAQVYIAGLATDYCVKYSALDALKLGFEVFVIEDACRGVNLDPGDSQKAFDQMRQAGAKVIQSSEILK